MIRQLALPLVVIGLLCFAVTERITGRSLSSPSQPLPQQPQKTRFLPGDAALLYEKDFEKIVASFHNAKGEHARKTKTKNRSKSKYVGFSHRWS